MSCTDQVHCVPASAEGISCIAFQMASDSNWILPDMPNYKYLVSSTWPGGETSKEKSHNVLDPQCWQCPMDTWRHTLKCPIDTWRHTCTFLNVPHRYLNAEGKWKLTSILSVKTRPKRAGNDRIGKGQSGHIIVLWQDISGQDRAKCVLKNPDQDSDQTKLLTLPSPDFRLKLSLKADKNLVPPSLDFPFQTFFKAD